MTKQGARVLPGHSRDVIVRNAHEVAREHVLRVRPRRVGVGIVDLEEDVLDPDPVSQGKGRGVVDGAEPEIPGEDLCRCHLRRRPPRGVLRDVVEAIEDSRTPADPTLRQADLYAWETQRNARE